MNKTGTAENIVCQDLAILGIFAVLKNFYHQVAHELFESELC